MEEPEPASARGRERAPLLMELDQRGVGPVGAEPRAPGRAIEEAESEGLLVVVHRAGEIGDLELDRAERKGVGEPVALGRETVGAGSRGLCAFGVAEDVVRGGRQIRWSS